MINAVPGSLSLNRGQELQASAIGRLLLSSGSPERSHQAGGCYGDLGLQSVIQWCAVSSVVRVHGKAQKGSWKPSDDVVSNVEDRLPQAGISSGCLPWRYLGNSSQRDPPSTWCLLNTTHENKRKYCVAWISPYTGVIVRYL